MSRGWHPGQRLVKRTACGSPGLICISLTYREDGRKMCSGDVPITFSGDIPSAFWQFSVLQTGTPPDRRRKKSLASTPRDFLALLAPMACGRGGYPHSRVHVLLQGR